jgi:hypothetical protein
MKMGITLRSRCVVLGAYLVFALFLPDTAFPGEKKHGAVEGPSVKTIVQNAYRGRFRVQMIRAVNGEVRLSGVEGISPSDLFDEIKVQYSSGASLSRSVLLLVRHVHDTASDEGQVKSDVLRWAVQTLGDRDQSARVAGYVILLLSRTDMENWPKDIRKLFERNVTRQFQGNGFSRKGALCLGKSISSAALDRLKPSIWASYEKRQKEIRPVKRKRNSYSHSYLLVLARHGDKKAFGLIMQKMTPEYRAGKGVEDFHYVGTTEAIAALLENVLTEGFVEPVISFSSASMPDMFGAGSTQVLAKVVEGIPSGIKDKIRQYPTWDVVVDLRNWVLNQNEIQILGTEQRIKVKQLQAMRYDTPTSVIQRIPKEYRGEAGIQRYRRDVSNARKTLQEEAKKRIEKKAEIGKAL